MYVCMYVYIYLYLSEFTKTDPKNIKLKVNIDTNHPPAMEHLKFSKEGIGVY